jgi:hypothetical protein
LISLRPLQVGNASVKIFIDPLIWFSIVVIVFKKLPKEPFRPIAVIMSIILFINFSCTHIIGFCGLISHGTSYIDKKDRSHRIVIKTYDCFLAAGDPEYFEERTIINNIKWVTQFKENPIDTTKWQHVFLSDQE